MNEPEASFDARHARTLIVTGATQGRIATRAEGLRRLNEFVPAAGRSYAAKRNFDAGPGRHTAVSTLSPYVRHRLITEAEVVAAVLRAHKPWDAEKFVQEVCWRTYWKGWLEHRPEVWDDYLEEVATQRAALQEDDALSAEIAAAERGDTGIACFDAWAQELVETGYVHNHARMWFASIWIFTLKLPWALGADFFMRHLADGDPASNTLSWRWVGGLQTRGKTYLARADNIATFTNGRFNPGRNELAAFAAPLEDVEPAPVGEPRVPADTAILGKIVLLLTEEDLAPELWPLGQADVVGIARFSSDDTGPGYAPLVREFKAAALADAGQRAVNRFGHTVQDVTTADALTAFAKARGAKSIVTTLVPVGFVRPEIDQWAHVCSAAGVPIRQIAHRWDSLFWPHATAGFFKLKGRIPAVLAKLHLSHDEPAP